MYRRAPADLEVTQTAMLADLPATGSGPWIASATGDQLHDEPTGAWTRARPSASGTGYFRLHRGAHRPWRTTDVSELLLEPGVTRVVRGVQPGEALGGRRGRDTMNSVGVAWRLFRVGGHDAWVQHPSDGGVADIADVLSPAAPAG